MGLIPESVLKRGPNPLRKCAPPLKIDCNHGHGAIDDVSGNMVQWKFIPSGCLAVSLALSLCSVTLDKLIIFSTSQFLI